MSTTLTMKAQAPYQQFQIGTSNVTADANGLISQVAPGSDIARVLLSFGCTVVAPLPTVDPHVAGAIWNNSGTVAISAG